VIRVIRGSFCRATTHRVALAHRHDLIHSLVVILHTIAVNIILARTVSLR